MRIGWNHYGSGSPNRVADDGVGTMGVARSYQGLLQNGWVPLLATSQIATTSRMAKAM